MAVIVLRKKLKISLKQVTLLSYTQRLTSAPLILIVVKSVSLRYFVFPTLTRPPFLDLKHSSLIKLINPRLNGINLSGRSSVNFSTEMTDDYHIKASSI